MNYRYPTLSAEYLDVISQIEKIRQQLKYQLQQHPRRWTGVLRRNTFAKAIQGSNSIEGYNVSVEDAVAAVDEEEPINKKDEAWYAVRGYREAMSYILQLAEDPHYEHNIGTLRSLHYMMIAYDISKNPGRWRPGSIYVKNEQNGEIVYEGPDVDLVPDLMDELVNSLNDPVSHHVFIRAAMAHLNLVMIHPFSDGNGRMGRALQTMVLSRDGILDPTFSSIEEWLGKNTQAYYNVLGTVGQGAWHPENDALLWVRFTLTAHYQQAQTLLRRIQEISELWTLIEREIESRRLPERAIIGLMDAAFSRRVRNSSYRKHTEVSVEVASKDLRALAKAELLVPHGEKRARYYVGSPLLLDLRQKVRKPKIQTDPFEKSSSQHILPGVEIA